MFSLLGCTSLLCFLYSCRPDDNPSLVACSYDIITMIEQTRMRNGWMAWRRIREDGTEDRMETNES